MPDTGWPPVSLPSGAGGKCTVETKKQTVATANIVENGIFKTKADAAIGPLKIFETSFEWLAVRLPASVPWIYDPSSRHCLTLACHYEVLQLKYGAAWDGKMPDLFHEEG